MSILPVPNLPGGIYHVMNRGNRKCRIYEDDRDRKRFTYMFAETLAQYGVELDLGVQMGTHFHAVLVTPRANLSDFMERLESRFARFSNWRHGRVGHLFQGPFRRVLIESDLQLFIVASYIFRNPVVAGIVNRPEDWKWSTYAATIGLAPTPSYLSTSWVDTLFPAASPEESRRLLHQCMYDPQPVRAYVQAVDPTLEVAIRSFVAENRQLLEQPCPYRILMRPTLDELFRQNQSESERATSILCAHETHGYKLAEIAKRIGRHRASVSRIYCRSRHAHGPTLLTAVPSPNIVAYLGPNLEIGG